MGYMYLIQGGRITGNFLFSDLSNKSSNLHIRSSLSLCCISICSISFEFCASNFSIKSLFKLCFFFSSNSALFSTVPSLSAFPLSIFLFKYLHLSSTHFYDLYQKTHKPLLKLYFHKPYQRLLYASN